MDTASFHKASFSGTLIRVSAVGVVAISAIVMVPSAIRLPSAAATDSENGRYSMVPAGDAVLRLDSRTGAVSSCAKGPQGWSCSAVPDERAVVDGEVARLQAEVEKLKTQLAAAGRTEPVPDKAESDKMASDNPLVKPKVALPSDQELDRMMTFVERAWRRLMGVAKRLEKEGSGPPI